MEVKYIKRKLRGENMDAGVIYRLKKAVDDSGGSAVVSRLSGVPLNSLGTYLKGTEPGFIRMASLAEACRVSLDWLAKGESVEDRPVSFGTFAAGLLDAPTHYLALVALICAEKEVHAKLNRRRALSETLNWVGVNYGPQTEGEDIPFEVIPQRKDVS